MAALYDIVTLVEGFTGSGKSATVVHDIANYFLPETNEVIITNLPLNVDALATFCARRYKLPENITRQRIRLLSPELVSSWRTGEEAGPWEYFRADKVPQAGVDLVQFSGQNPLAGALLILDEFQKFCPRRGFVERRRHWNAFVSTLRHEGARMVLITQNTKLIDELLLDSHVSALRIVHKQDEQLDPVWQIPLGDIWQVKSAWFDGGVWCPVVKIAYHTKECGTSSIGKALKTQICELNTDVYALYDSHSVEREGGARGNVQQHEFTKRGRWGILCWFLRRHWFKVVFSSYYSRWAWAIFLMSTFLGFGGIAWFTNYATASINPAGSVVAPRPGVAAQQLLSSAAESHRLYGGLEARIYEFDIGGSVLSVPTEKLPIELAKALERAAAVEDGEDPQEVVAISRYRAVMGDGSVLSIGDKIPWETDRYVLAIVPQSGVVYLDDGSELRLRNRPRYPTAGGDRGAVQIGLGAPVLSNGGASGRGPLELIGGGSAAASVRADTL